MTRSPNRGAVEGTGFNLVAALSCAWLLAVGCGPPASVGENTDDLESSQCGADAGPKKETVCVCSARARLDPGALVAREDLAQRAVEYFELIPPRDARGDVVALSSESVAAAVEAVYPELERMFSPKSTGDFCSMLAGSIDQFPAPRLRIRKLQALTTWCESDAGSYGRLPEFFQAQFVQRASREFFVRVSRNAVLMQILATNLLSEANAWSFLTFVQLRLDDMKPCVVDVPPSERFDCRVVERDVQAGGIPD